ncbi:SDR family NAD(P)-dependent oxidoreductase [Salinisphaera sp. Q1T1-3]|uniref:SDR family NAD(P)-dependent oxidoreductase n=1 Tax=Salinisphaera sp. Q1T1-3 TaxID=2321229 RepID=UPI0018F76901|nr:SDR family NAD(P)-dependent oxidoreductase [Salinisphaera sp. Q1T1-3]
MSQHPAIAASNAAVVTGAASGIGHAAAVHFAAHGMHVVLVDRPGHPLDDAASDVLDAARKAGHAHSVVEARAADVADFAAVQALADAVFAAYDHVGVVMNNAGVNGGGGVFEKHDRWQTLMQVNLWGVLHGCQAFGPRLVAQNGPAAIINTGSKQGLTNPPGDAAYNVTKAGVKAYTEAMAHELREMTGDDRVTTHLLVPGFTYTGMSKSRHPTQPAEAWTPAQVIDYMDTALAAGDFYIICPDNAVDAATDRRRIAWAAGDITENRPALSRWHSDYRQTFADYVDGSTS